MEAAVREIVYNWLEGSRTADEAMQAIALIVMPTPCPENAVQENVVGGSC